MKTNQTYQTTYAVATSYIGSLIQAKNINGVQCLLSSYEEVGYDIDEETGEYPDVMEYYLTDLNKSRCEWLSQHFGLMFAYCTALDLWVLLVPHCGTGWDYVRLSTDLEECVAPLGTSKLN
jgi:hypothetical protein